VAIDPHTRGVSYANAGHTPGYILDRKGRLRMELTSTGLVLGLFGDATFVTEKGPDLQQGDLLALFTDGVTEAQDSNGTMCGAEWALDVVRARAHLTSAEILDALCEAVRSITGERAQQDDLTAIVCRVGAREASAATERRQAARRGAAGTRRKTS
jgi:serine phosphatase RsbU (regulator of sigma subunit)